MTTAADLAADTTVKLLLGSDDVYRTVLPNSWDYLLPSGGAVMTVALRAAQTALSEPRMRLLSATSIFCKPVPAGPCEVQATVLRRGKNVSQVRASLRVAGDLAMEVSASFGRLRIGPDVRGAKFPDVRSLQHSTATDGPNSPSGNPYQMFRFYQQLECRIAEGDIHWRDDSFIAGPARYARWMRYKKPQLDATGVFDRLALPPLIDTMPSALHRAIGQHGANDYRFYAPSLDLTIHVVADTTCEWLLLRSYVRRAADGYAIADIEVWDEAQQLIAFGCQSMYLHTVSGTPPVVDASNRG
jgi:acyl-CoA thioesterase